eukprot:TRINITY_DN5684_c2_g1_i1.p3 TRINITY_DN5684_c2_g1~~TRINITY_DN5684_c2_g1_i1.p3  ORF type:complete len:207 (+),score=-27.03 TRINITY_DN5684_c2_g1_i1:834-1454(+)
MRVVVLEIRCDHGLVAKTGTPVAYGHESVHAAPLGVGANALPPNVAQFGLIELICPVQHNAGADASQRRAREQTADTAVAWRTTQASALSDGHPRGVTQCAHGDLVRADERHGIPRGVRGNADVEWQGAPHEMQCGAQQRLAHGVLVSDDFERCDGRGEHDAEAPLGHFLRHWRERDARGRHRQKSGNRGQLNVKLLECGRALGAR